MNASIVGVNERSYHAFKCTINEHSQHVFKRTINDRSYHAFKHKIDKRSYRVFKRMIDEQQKIIRLTYNVDSKNIACLNECFYRAFKQTQNDV